ncbi:MAG: ABC transporter substrate-binding protein [Blastocatellia bacterium]|nr:ABC transporter substrate-binding protein [Blastocatellia bacterium]MCS7158582.1 ABC transporter substrate-binding protein [Blastocatellia bacterium]MDW8169292.1 ABC transporter substrate-binding protein [Acidobacteriota bacterium]MDW8257778.1 ABC transporter substrate-binding protein [Acidobacteriota bacterium]
MVLILLGFLPPLGCHRPQQTHTLVIAIEAPPLTFDPRGPTNAVTARLQQLLFNTLTQKDERFEIIPELAESWEISDDFTVYTFRLRRGVRFHDGRELTARDVAYTFNTLIAPTFDSPKRAALSKLERVEPVDSHTVVFRCREPYRGLLVDLIAIGIIPEHSGETIARQPIGTGPFRFVRYVENQEVELLAFPEHFQGAPRVRQLRVKIVRDPTTLALELLGGTVHFALNAQLSPDFVAEQQASQQLQVAISDGAALEYLGLNTTDPILRDRRVRQAIAYGINRQAIIVNLLRGQARPAKSVLPPTHWAYHETVKTYEYDPARARQLLDEAGYRDPDGEGPQPRFRLTLKTSSAEHPRKIATALQEQLRAIGIELQIQSFEFQTFLNDINTGNFQLFFLRQIGANQFPDIFKAAFGSRSIPNDPTIRESERTGFLNRARYRNPQLDVLIARAEAANDRAEQRALYARIQEILAEDVPWIYLWYPANIALANPRVRIPTIPTSGDFQFLKDVEVP